MKVLCVIDSLGSGGAQRQLVVLAIGFKKEGHEVSFLTYHNIPFFKPVLEDARISVDCIIEPNYLLRILKMRKFIRYGKFDIVFSFLEAPNFICEFSGLPNRKWKLVVGERSSNPEIKKSFKLKIYRWFHFFADYIVANSKTNLNLVYSACPILPVSRCKVIYNSVDFDLWKPEGEDTMGLNSKFKLVVAARHAYHKNLNGLVEAVALLTEKDRNKLNIEWYGDNIVAPYIDNSYLEAVNKIKSYGFDKIITFFPATRDIAKHVQNADAVGIFSFYEGFPNSVCEGMACAKPVISSNVSDTPEFLSYDKNLICDPAKPQSIKDAISYVINMPKDLLIKLGKENENVAKENFNKELIVSQYLQLFII